jgi:hypothetical protein
MVTTTEIILVFIFISLFYIFVLKYQSIKGENIATLSEDANKYKKEAVLEKKHRLNAEQEIENTRKESEMNLNKERRKSGTRGIECCS